jgi:hypothetical protein
MRLNLEHLGIGSRVLKVDDWTSATVLVVKGKRLQMNPDATWDVIMLFVMPT